jgi:lysozyme
VASFGVYYLNDYFSRPLFIRYKEFGIDLPRGYNIHGIDVSRWQKHIEWSEVKDMYVDDVQIKFAIIKATEGTDLTDERFFKNMEDAKNAGLHRGAYHFFNPARSGRLQADHYLARVHLKEGDIPPVLDVEVENGATAEQIRTRVKEWLDIVEKKYKVKPIIYSNIHFYNRYLSGEFDDYPLWIAHYLQKERPRIQRSWIIWQHSDGGHVNGIEPVVDFNVFNGDSAAFRQMLLK